MKNVCYVYTWPAAGLTSRASPRDVSRDTFTVGWEKKKGRTREAIETRRKTLDGWKINGPVADLFSFQHCERAVHGRSLWRATIFFFFFSFFARSSSHALHECSGHQFFLFFFFFFHCFPRCIVTRWPIAVDRGSRGAIKVPFSRYRAARTTQRRQTFQADRILSKRHF